MAYPTSLDNLPTNAVDGTGPTDTNPLAVLTAAELNAVTTAINAIEATLGLSPMGTDATVKARLDRIETALGAKVVVAGDLGGTASAPVVIRLQGQPVSSTAPTSSQVLQWNGAAWAPASLAGGGSVSSVVGQTGAVTGAQILADATVAAALAAKAPLASPALTGTPTAPTGTAGTGGTQVATQAYADTSASTAATAAQAASLQKASNLSDLASAATARTNLGLGTAATQPSTDFAAAATSAVPTTGAASTATTGTLTAGQVARVDSTAADLTRTLPAASSVAAGGVVVVRDLGTRAAALVTIQPSGSDTINGAASARVLRRPEVGITLVSDGTAGWTVVSTDTPQSALSGTYAPVAATVQALGNVTGTATITTSGTWVTATLTGSTTFAFPAPATGSAYTFTLEVAQDATGGRAVTWPASVVWPGGSAPAIATAASAVMLFSFTTRNGGTTWYGSPQSISPAVNGTPETVNTVAAAGAAQTIPDPTTATINNLTLSAATCTLTFPTAAAGKSFSLVLRQDATGGRLVTWPTVTWIGSSSAAPTLSTSGGKQDVFTFMCVDGSTWLGLYGGAS